MNPNTIAEQFNNFYVNIGKNLSQNIPQTSKDPLEYIKENNCNSIFVEEADETEICRIITGLKEGSAGWDEIHAKVIKCSYKLFMKPLVFLINKSLTQGVVPRELKRAKVIPIFKSGDPMLIKNFRPVSVLPLFSKLFERVMYNRLINFINRNNLLYRYQFGFREKHSTAMALMVLTDNIYDAIEQGDCYLGVFLDFSKAFDTVNHGILVRKLQQYGIRGVVLDWLINYLSDRCQYVSFSNVRSCDQMVSCGVPQGSILGPLLFLLYINDIASVSNLLTPILFADDSSLFIKGNEIDTMIESLNMELTHIKTWVDANKLSLNVEKTHSMVFSSARKIVKCNRNIEIDGKVISKTDSIKFLGVILDSHLSWKKHVIHIKSKVSKGIGILSKARKYLNRSILVSLYYSFIYPYFSYCVEVWGSAGKTTLEKLIVLQKKIVRVIASIPYRESTKKSFKSLKFLNINEIYIYKLGTFMFNVTKLTFPVIFQSFFQYSERNAYNIRNRNIYSIPLFKTTLAQTGVRYTGARLWNKLFTLIDCQCSIHSFKRRLKTVLLTQDIV
jgi:hypothetical protein